MKILVTLDGSELSGAVLEYVKPLARAMEAEIHLLRVCQPPPRHEIYNSEALRAWAATNWLQAIFPSYQSPEPRPLATYDQIVAQVKDELSIYLKEKAAAFGNLSVRTTVAINEDVSAAIISYTSENSIDLIAMATHGRSGFTALVLGSVAQKVAASGVAPVLLVRPRLAEVAAARHSAG